MTLRFPDWLAYALASLGVLACTSTDPEPSDAGVGGAGAETLQPKMVPASPELVEGTGFCVALNEGETLWSVSPEGHAWIASGDDSTQQLRVLDAFDESAVLEDPLALGTFHHVRAWSQTDAAVAASDGLWSLEDLARVELTPPTDLADVTSMCGDPAVNGMLLSAGSLLELRDDKWWVWDDKAGGSDAPRDMASFDGDCIGTDNLSWLMADDGSLWQLSAAEYVELKQFEAGASVSATTGMLAVLESRQLWIGPAPWQPWLFEGAMPTAVSASGGKLWLAAAEQLLRYDGESFVRVSHELDGSIAKVMAHGSGVWLGGESRVCHVSTTPMLRIEGLRSYSRAKQADYEFSVSASDASLTITASLEGEPVTLAVDDDSGDWVGQLALAGIGWHELRLEADGVARAIPIKRLPEVERSWANDIEPIYAAHCAKSNCHGDPSTDMPALSTYEQWVEDATLIKNRVVLAGTMPPPSAQGPDWGEEQVTMINEWIEGGMLP